MSSNSKLKVYPWSDSVNAENWENEHLEKLLGLNSSVLKYIH